MVDLQTSCFLRKQIYTVCVLCVHVYTLVQVGIVSQFFKYIDRSLGKEVWVLARNSSPGANYKRHRESLEMFWAPAVLSI